VGKGWLKFGSSATKGRSQVNERIKSLIVVSIMAMLTATASTLIAKLDDIPAIIVAVAVWFVLVGLLGWIVNRKPIK
jgi:hypothetical protein